MTAKHGSEQAVKDFMKSAQEKSMLNPNRQKGSHKGGFSYMDEKTHKQVSAKGGQAKRTA